MFKKLSLQICVMRLIHPTIRSGLFRLNRFPLLCVLLVVGSAGLLAQEPATSFDQLHLVMGKGDKVTLVDASGNKITGRIDRIAPNALDLKVGAKVQTFSENDIRQITENKPDSPLNGFLIGAGIGFGATLPVNFAIADRDETGLAVYASALWGLIGGGIGALVDACIHEKHSVYFRTRSNVSWTISPFYSELSTKTQKPGTRAFLADLPPNTGVQSSKGFRVTLRF
jgi:hypothetical protein